MGAQSCRREENENVQYQEDDNIDIVEGGEDQGEIDDDDENDEQENELAGNAPQQPEFDTAALTELYRVVKLRNEDRDKLKLLEAL